MRMQADRRLLLVLSVLLLLVAGARGQAPQAPPARPDLATQPTLYVVGYAHLDTQWRWDYVQTIREYLPKTVRDNVALFEKYPHYVFNFSGANRYRLLKEYFPDDYATVKRYVAAGRWFPAGSSMEESDVNVPSAESIFRQILYGSRFFRREFGRSSAEYMLPDCFGFPASLPSILVHAGIKGFSTQKLTWGSAVGIPFNIGIWEGPDGRGVIAAFNPLSYAGQVRDDLSKSELWLKRIRETGERSGLFVDYHYYGTGDTGGSPREDSVRLVEAIVTKRRAVLPPPAGRGGQPAAAVPEPGPPVQMGEGPIRVISATAEQMFLDIDPARTDRLPRYRGDLLLTQHSAGSITSQAVMKRWNRQNEVLADAAERVSVVAAWLGGRPYPRDRLTAAWTLVMGGQFHDILPGTSIPKAYEYSWNDEVLALNQFAGVVTSAVAAVGAVLDTRAAERAIVVYNPLDIEREDLVEVELPRAPAKVASVRVVGPDGEDVPAQLVPARSGRVRTLFLARVPPVGFAVYDVRVGEAPRVAASPLRVSETELENARYRVRVDASGDVASVFDKRLGREILAEPIRLAIKTDKPVDWPAWNMDWADQAQPPRHYVGGPATIRVVERGPARVALEVTREAEGSRFVQTIRLAAGGAGDRVEFANLIDWKTSEANLKAVFPLAAANPEATYNWDIGTVRRGNNHEKQYEVPSHQWFDLTDAGGRFGVTILSDCKYGSDKPDDRTLRLTLLRTPGIGTGNARAYSDQATQDWGRHEFIYGLAAHAGDWREGETDWQAYRLNQPLLAFESPAHEGPFGKRFSAARLSHGRVRVLALKQAEESDEIVIRLVEMDGRPASGVELRFAAPVVSAREVDAQERPVGPATVRNGALVADFGAFQPRTFALRLGPPPVSVAAPRSQPIRLSYDVAVATRDGERAAGGFDASGRSLPAELLPETVEFGGVRFALAPGGAGQPNAVAARGQTIRLPGGRFTRLYLLAAAAEGDERGVFRVGDREVDLTVQGWTGYVGQWDNRVWRRREEPVPPRPGTPAPPPGTPPRMRTVLEYAGLTPGFIKRAPVAWFASHHHTAEGVNEPYAYSYLFAYAVDLPVGARTLTLPQNPKIRVLAVTVADAGPEVRPAHPLYDTLER